MGFNYAKEKKKFERQWATIRKQYEEAGMGPDAIEELHDFDWDWFKSRRRYISHLADLPDGITVEDIPQADTGTNPGDIPALCSMEQRRWLDAIEDEQLLQKLMLLSNDDLELLTALAFEGYTQSDIAQKRACSRMAISKQMHKIKKILN